MKNYLYNINNPGASGQAEEEHMLLPRYLKAQIHPSALQLIKPLDYEHQALDPMTHNPSKPVNYKAFKVLQPKKF